MSRRSRRQLILAIVATDATFERVSWRGREAWQGSCIHCRRRLLIDAGGEPLGAATVEHIVPQRHGGGDELDNLALACARCDHQKGYRLDDRRPDDPVLVRVIHALRERRRARWRDLVVLCEIGLAQPNQARALTRSGGRSLVCRRRQADGSASQGRADSRARVASGVPTGTPSPPQHWTVRAISHSPTRPGRHRAANRMTPSPATPTIQTRVRT